MWVKNTLPSQSVEIISDGSYVAGATVSISGVRRSFLSVHVGPPNYRRHLRVLVDRLSSVLTGTSFVVAGDLNAARHVDVVYGGKWFGRFFRDLSD